MVERPYGCKPIGSKWVFKKKPRPDGTIERYKVRLVIKCFHKRKVKIYLILTHMWLD
jgi:hypothetical protein